jgi:condensin complex subunit 3
MIERSPPSQKMARQSFNLFLSQVQVEKKTPEQLKLRVLQAIFDIIMVHEQDFLDKGSDKVSVCGTPLHGA